MPIIQTRVFRRVCLNTDTEVEAAMTAVVQEANAFMASFTNLGDVLGAEYRLFPLGNNPERSVFVGTVAYVETGIP